MFAKLFEIIINMFATLIQVIVLPINLVISNTLPNFSDSIVYITSMITNVMSAIVWPLSWLPNSFKTIYAIMLTIEIAKHTIFVSTHSLIKVWEILQRIKFW